ncbi:MAG: hypothetical protein ACJARX_000024 [Psychroserpens sp.]|jgi:hypothetical protein
MVLFSSETETQKVHFIENQIQTICGEMYNP